MNQPEKSLITMMMMLKRMRGSRRNWHAWMSPITCPFSVFLLSLDISANVHPLRPRNRSSFRIANAFANSKSPSRRLQNPISACVCNQKVSRNIRRLMFRIHLRTRSSRKKNTYIGLNREENQNLGTQKSFCDELRSNS